MRHFPDFITFLRLMASPIVAGLVLQSRFREALGLVLFAGVTDWLDGFAARRLGVGGKLGVILDPLADKVLLVTLFVVLGVAGLVPVWLVLLTIGRDLVIVVGALLLRMFRNVHRFAPSTLGKVSTFFQIVLVLLVLLHAAFPYEFILWLEITAIVLSTVFTTLSGMEYIRLGIRLTARRNAGAA